MKPALEFAILCSNRWLKIEVTAWQKSSFSRSVTCMCACMGLYWSYTKYTSNSAARLHVEFHGAFGSHSYRGLPLLITSPLEIPTGYRGQENERRPPVQISAHSLHFYCCWVLTEQCCFLWWELRPRNRPETTLVACTVMGCSGQ